MARCKLDLTHPHFLGSLKRLEDNPDFKQVLLDFKEKVEKEHTSCGRVVQQFYGNQKYTHLHGKIWKYDWGQSSASGRKSWRLVVVVPDLEANPLKLIAAAMYTKSMATQLPLKELAAIFAGVTTSQPEIAATAPEINTSREFHRVPNGDGQKRSICFQCYALVAVSPDVEALDTAERDHKCEPS
jgi:hypothetical protein